MAYSGGGSLIQPLILVESLGTALLIFIIVSKIAAHRIDQSWQDKLPSTKRDRLIRRYCTPLFQGRFKRSMRRALDRNPVAWLQQYSWKARAGKWSLCLAFVILECVMTGRSLSEIQQLQIIITVVLAVVFTFVGVNSFLEEKKSGALELILITPLSVNQIILGRVWGLWKQFLPAGLVIAGFFIAATHSMTIYHEPGEMFMPFLCVPFGYLSLPFLATYSSLRVKNLIVAAVLTWIALALAPTLGFGLLHEICCRLHLELSEHSFVDLIYAGIILGNTAFALLACFLPRHSLSRRIYSL